MRFTSTVVGMLVAILVVVSLGGLVLGVKLYLDVTRHPPGAAGAPEHVNVAEAESVLREKLETYNKRAEDLQKLISVLLALSAIYTLALGLSSYTSVQSNLEQAKESVQRAEKAVEKLETLVREQEEIKRKARDEILYAGRIASAGGSLALALQGKYLGDAELAVARLLELRAERPTDRYVNLFIGRLYKALGRYPDAVAAVSHFINHKEQAQQGRDTDTADAYFNRACYQSLQWQTAPVLERRRLREGIERDLKHCIGLYPQYAEYAADTEERDFDPVRAEDWFRVLLNR